MNCFSLMGSSLPLIKSLRVSITWWSLVFLLSRRYTGGGGLAADKYTKDVSDCKKVYEIYMQRQNKPRENNYERPMTNVCLLTRLNMGQEEELQLFWLTGSYFHKEDIMGVKNLFDSFDALGKLQSSHYASSNTFLFYFELF